MWRGHDPIPKRKLKGLLEEEGLDDLSRQARRCERLLRDACGNDRLYRRNIYLLMLALRGGR
jgi:hypothetical protein